VNQTQGQPSWKLTEMHHIGLTVSDIERSIVFYRDTLGLELVGRRPSVAAGYVGQQTGYDGVELNVASFRVHANSQQSIEMVQYMNHVGQPIAPATNRAGSTHLCLLVDDLQESVKDLKSRGVCFKSEPVSITAGPNQGGLVIYLLDPDGYTLELFQPPIPPGGDD